MGLDISVYKVSEKETDTFFVLSENPELETFKEKAQIKENEYFNLELAAKKAGHNLEDLTWEQTSYGEEPVFYFRTKTNKKVELKNPPTLKRKELVLYAEEVGYQRKGANKKFYEDGMWDSACVTNLSVLKEHHKKYFSSNTPESKGGWGSGVEFELSDEEMKKRFQENIINKFEKGKTFVVYH